MKAALCIVLAALAPIGAGKAIGQVLNLSHDLVPLGIAAQNLLPDNPALDAGPLIFAGTQYAFNHAIPRVTLDKGNYYLLTPQDPYQTLAFPGLSNLTVDLAGSTLWFKGPLLTSGLALFQCSHFTLTNFQIDFLNTPYTHVRLTSVDAAQRRIAYQTLPGWPDPASFNDLMSPYGGPIEGIWAAFFREGSIVPGTTRTQITRPVSGNTLVLTQDGTPWTQGTTLSTLRAGDVVAVTARGGGPPILVWEGDSITLSNITIYGSPNWAVNVYATRNSTVDGVRVLPRPVTGLIGSVADGIHFSSMRENNRLRNSYVTRTLDDAFIMENLHAARVVAQTSPRQLTVTRQLYQRFSNGTAMNFVDPATTVETAGAIIVSQDPPDSNQVPFNGQVNLTFDRDLPPLAAGIGLVYASSTMRGQGSTIEDNVAEDVYAGRGIWLSGVRGVKVQRNVVRGTSQAGIIVAQSTDPHDLTSFGPPAHDVVISENLVEGALGTASNSTGAQTGLASIQVVSTDNQLFGFASASGNTNISIVDNTILDSGRSGIWVGEVNGGTIARNRVLGHNRHPELPIFGIPPPFLAQVQSDFAVPLVVRYSTGVTKQDNVIRPTGGRRDLNGDSSSDLLWKNAATGASALWLMNGTAIAAATTLLSGSAWFVDKTADLNADGRIDILWRNGTTGQTAAWLMEGTALLSAAYLLGDPNWRVAHTGDFNGDGRADLVWRNGTTGATAIWLMNGTVATAFAVELVDPNWSVTHVGDMNNDGKDDLVWRNGATGQAAVWLMDGTVVVAGAILPGDPSWRVTHMGDFNGDGRADLVWRNDTTGATAIWLMNGTAASAFAIELVDANWSVTHVADLNNDGKDDLVWRNGATGQTAAWLMNGTTPVSSAILLVDPNWSVKDTGDFNGDGRTDLVWRNDITGATAIWLMDGTSAIAFATELVDLNWSPVPTGSP